MLSVCLAPGVASGACLCIVSLLKACQPLFVLMCPAEPAPSFDMETAFKVLRSAGYAQHALSVAERAGQPEWVLDVLLEDLGQYPEALAFIGELCHAAELQCRRILAYVQHCILVIHICMHAELHAVAWSTEHQPMGDATAHFACDAIQDLNG